MSIKSLSPRPIELLVPARDAEIGIEAIRHGADAVYIGASDFGARHQAGNSVEDIARLCEFAHIFGARIYVTVNTILYDEELSEVETLIHRLYDAGADALIVQDMALLRMNLPPIDLHASTQMDIRTPEKAAFLGGVGFSQLVLARELSLDEIRAVSQSTQATIEAFVHGALCVSYSGCCYASEFCFDRSANRGRCAQFCRHSFNLLDATDHVIVCNSYLLSLRDMNRSHSLEDMLDAGVSSFKIEGRLKDLAYVKNLTTYYRNQLDEIIARRPADFCRASIGHIESHFTPNPSRSFNRGFTEYFLHQRTAVQSFESPKSRGQYIGNVQKVEARRLMVQLETPLHAGDGLCYINGRGMLEGFRVNKVEGSYVYPATMPTIDVGTPLYRNQDIEFDKLLAHPSAERKIAIHIALKTTNDGFSLVLTDETGLGVDCPIPSAHQLANTPQRDNLLRILGKLGNTPFVATSISLPEENYFLPSSLLTQVRRKATDELLSLRLKHHIRRQRKPEASIPYLTDTLDYTANVSNRLARQFYKDHGVQTIAPAMEVQKPARPVLMECKHCIRFALGYCSKNGKALPFPESLSLQSADGRRFPLRFDCHRCVMQVLPPL